jgi:hypothetical protein
LYDFNILVTFFLFSPEIIRNDEEIFGVHEKQKLIKENNFWMEFQEEDEATLLSFVLLL